LYLKALVVVATAFAGQLEDPTFGANRSHLHSENPNWAAGKSAIALIGHRFYYRM